MRQHYKTKVNDKTVNITIVEHHDGEQSFPYEIIFKYDNSNTSNIHAWIYKLESHLKCNQAVIKGLYQGFLEDTPLDINDINDTFSPLLISTSYTWLTTNINNSVNYQDFMEHTVGIKVYSV